MADYGATYTDKTIIELDKEIQAVYKEAEKDIQKKMDDFNAKYKIKEQKYQQKVDSGQMTQEEFDRWKKGQVFQGQQWQAKKDQILDTMHHSNEIATKIINGQSQNIFMVNANYMSYDIEHGAGVNFGFGLYDQNTVANLIANDPKLLPEWKINEKKDYIWSQKKLNNAITQGIIQGESLDKISKRISDKLASTNENKMKTFARTAMTGAQNSGRQMQLENAKKLDINLQKEWMATLDARTRDSHKDMDGEKVDVDKKFSNGLMFPGDPNGTPAETYNCRCTMVSDVKKYPATYDRYDNINGQKIKNMSYKEWVKAKGMEKKSKPAASKPVSIVVNGKDISQTWQRRSTGFAFEIEDVINAQGFDGLPRVVSADKFDKYVQESNIIMQRAYSAPDQETLKAYQDELYNGKWYVDCSTGGARHGQGMYCVANYDGTITSGMASEMEGYATMYGNRPAYVETFTVDPSAQFIEENSAREMMRDYNRTVIERSYKDALSETLTNEAVTDMIEKYEKYFSVTMSEEEMSIYARAMQLKNMKSPAYSGELKKEADKIIKKYKLKDHSLVESKYRTTQAYKDAAKEQFGDVGSFAASKGYDGLMVSDRNGEVPYAVILNRTKVIFKKGG